MNNGQDKCGKMMKCIGHDGFYVPDYAQPCRLRRPCPIHDEPPMTSSRRGRDRNVARDVLGLVVILAVLIVMATVASWLSK